MAYVLQMSLGCTMGHCFFLSQLSNIIYLPSRPLYKGTFEADRIEIVFVPAWVVATVLPLLVSAITKMARRSPPPLPPRSKYGNNGVWAESGYV